MTIGQHPRQIGGGCVRTGLPRTHALRPASPGALAPVLLLLLGRVLGVGRVTKAGDDDEGCEREAGIQPGSDPRADGAAGKIRGRDGVDDAPMPLRKKTNQPTPPPPRGLYDDPFFFLVLTPWVMGLSVVRIADDDETEMMLVRARAGGRPVSLGLIALLTGRASGPTRGTRTPGPSAPRSRGKGSSASSHSP
jgi:hypothetical protein